MNETKFINSESYLEKLNQVKYDPESEEILTSVQNLEKSMFQDSEIVNNSEEYLNKDMSLENSECTLNFKYVQLEEPYLKEKILNDLQPKYNIDIKNLYILKKFIISLKNNETKLDIFTLLPNDYEIIFTPHTINPPETKSSGCLNIIDNFIYTYGDPTSKAFPITLLHEIGHIVDKENLKKNNVKSLINEDQYSDYAEELRRERTASAYAINKLRPFVKSKFIDKKDLLNYLKNDSLGSHCSVIEFNIARLELRKETGELINKYITSLEYYETIINEYAMLIEEHQKLNNDLIQIQIDKEIADEELQSLLYKNEIEKHEKRIKEYKSEIEEYKKHIEECEEEIEEYENEIEECEEEIEEYENEIEYSLNMIKESDEIAEYNS